VLLTVAGSLAGVFAALHAGGATFNISSFVGAIMMVGIVAENAYFLVAAYGARRVEGDSVAVAAERRGAATYAPVLMTTAAGVAALGPRARIRGGKRSVAPARARRGGGFVDVRAVAADRLALLLALVGRRE